MRISIAMLFQHWHSQPAVFWVVRRGEGNQLQDEVQGSKLGQVFQLFKFFAVLFGYNSAHFHLVDAIRPEAGEGMN